MNGLVDQLYIIKVPEYLGTFEGRVPLNSYPLRLKLMYGTTVVPPTNPLGLSK